MTLLLSGLLLLIYLFLSIKVSNAVKQVANVNHKIVKFFAIIIPLYLLSYPLIGLVGYIGGFQSIISAFRFGNKILDVFFVYPFWFGLVFAIQTILPILVIDILKLIISPLVASVIQMKINFIYPRLIILLTITTALYSGIKIYKDTNSIELTTINLKLQIPPSLNGLKIVHISDIQADAKTQREKMEKYIKLVNSLEPDIVVFTGDIVTYGTTYIPIGVEMLSKIKSKFGLYSCIGDHDYWAGINFISSEMKKYGLKLYDNENTIIKIDSTTIGLTLVTNIYSKRPNNDELLNLASQNKADLKILITHQPSESLVKFAHENGYKIFLAGHTHGGQVVFSFFGYKLIPSKIETEYASGYYYVNSMLVNVNKGLGFTLAPIRFNAPAEVTLIKLSSQN
ncbi:MAG: metallophosphoesterase [Candidatus Kryptonium sp.]|nr:metallophosphoesterase [Candidatus Kryptonium sp.]MDW8108056.1 metallophosphoesterase [Candidatus Kryptonium sp.]